VGHLNKKKGTPGHPKLRHITRPTLDTREPFAKKEAVELSQCAHLFLCCSALSLLFCFAPLFLALLLCLSARLAPQNVIPILPNTDTCWNKVWKC
jgi:hypothetical protein